MRYYSDEKELEFAGIVPDDGYAQDDQPMGCEAPTADYGRTSGVATYEQGLRDGAFIEVPESDWGDWIEHIEASRASLQHRIDADWEQPLSQGRLGYCWSYAVTGAMQACDSRDGVPYDPLAGAWAAAQIKNGRDEGGWPVDAAEFVAKNGICNLSSWADCSCTGSSCKGTRGGCQARDLSRVSGLQAEASKRKLHKYYELPRDDMAATVSLLLQGIPVAAGWVGFKNLWCSGHAMVLTRVVSTKRGGVELVPDNSWKEYKRRTLVPYAPTGGVAVVSNTVQL